MYLRKIIIVLLGIVLMQSQYSFSQVLFEDDFDSFSNGWKPSTSATGWHCYPFGSDWDGGYGGLRNYEPSSVAADQRNNNNSWNGWIRYGNTVDGTYQGNLEIITTQGRSDSPCLRIEMAAGNESNIRPEDLGLIKWLGPSRHQELYVRYYFKFGDDFKWGNGAKEIIKDGSGIIWKQLRFWAGVTLDNNRDSQKTMPKIDLVLSKEANWGDPVVPRMVFKDYGGNSPFLAVSSFHGTDSQHCRNDGVQCSRHYWSTNPDGWLSTYCGPLNLNPNLSSYTCDDAHPEYGTFQNEQTWHSVEYHVKYKSTASSNDSIFEVWIDGRKLSEPNLKDGPLVSVMPQDPDDYGINMIVFNGNYYGLTWCRDTPQYLYLDDIVISTEYIGSAEPGGTIPPGQMPGVVPDVNTIVR